MKDIPSDYIEYFSEKLWRHDVYMGMRDWHRTDRIYVHYGHNKFDINLFQPARNASYRDKPIGGLWASPKDSTFGWREWNQLNEYKECDDNNCFYFKIAEFSRVYRIRTLHDIEQLPMVTVPKQKDRNCYDHRFFIDFEKLMRSGIDAIEVQFEGVKEYLWDYDCDSIIVLNARGIIEAFDVKEYNTLITEYDLKTK